MPTDLELLDELGYDPLKYKVENNRVVPIQQPDTTSQTTGNVDPKTGGGISESLKAAGLSFAHKALPTGAAVLGGAGAGALASSWTANPYIPLATGLIGAVGAGMAAQGAEDKILQAKFPELYKTITESEAQHPVASFAGDLASMLLYNKLGAAKSLISGAGKLARYPFEDEAARIGLTAAEKLNLVNAGAMTALPFGQEAVMSTIQNRPYEWGPTLANAGAGLVLSQPRPWLGNVPGVGKFFPPEALNPREIITDISKAPLARDESYMPRELVEGTPEYKANAVEVARRAQNEADLQGAMNEVRGRLQKQEEAKLAQQVLAQEQLKAQKADEQSQLIRAMDDVRTRIEADAIAKQNQRAEVQQATDILRYNMLTPERQNAKNPMSYITEGRRYNEAEKARLKEEKTRVEDFKKVRQEEVAPPEEPLTKPIELEKIKTQQLETLHKIEQEKTKQLETQVKAQTTQEVGVYEAQKAVEAAAINAERNAQIELARRAQELKSAPPKEFSRMYLREQETSGVKEATPSETTPKTPPPLPPTLTPEESTHVKNFENRQKEIATTVAKRKVESGRWIGSDKAILEQHGIEMRVFPEVKSEGKVVQGKLTQEDTKQGLKQFVAHLSTSRGYDTAGHEAGHKVHYTEFANSPSKRVRDTHAKMLDIVSKDPEYQALKKAGRISDPEEYIVTRAGEERVRSLATKGGKVGQAWKDFVSAVKLRYSNPTREDIVRIYRRKLTQEPHVAEKKASGVAIPEMEKEKTQQEETYAQRIPSNKEESAEERRSLVRGDENRSSDIQQETPRTSDEERKQEVSGLPRPVDESANASRLADDIVSTGARKEQTPIERKSSPLGFGAAQFDKVKYKLQSKTGDYVSDKFHQYGDDKSFNEGKFHNAPLDDLAKAKLGSDQETAAMDFLVNQDVERSVLDASNLDPNTRNYVENTFRDWYKSIHEGQRKRNWLINGRPVIDDPSHLPSVMDIKYQQALLNKPGSDEYNFVKNEWKRHLIDKRGLDEAKADEVIEGYIHGIGAKRGEFNEQMFKALREAEGFGMPASIRTKSLYDLISRYGRRVAKDFAFYDRIQSDPAMRKALGIADANGERNYEGAVLPDGSDVTFVGNVPEVRDAITYIGENYGHKDSIFNAFTKGINSMVMQAPTGGRNFLQNFGTALAYAQPSQAHTILTSITKMGNKWNEALRSNAYTKNINEYEFGLDNHVNWFNRLMDKFSYVVNHLSGRDLLEKASRVHTYAFSDGIIRMNHEAALANKTWAKEWFKKLNHGEEIPANPDEEWFARQAKILTDRIQGSYDARGLPLSVVDSPVAPFFSLARWSMERTNRVYNDVYKPLKAGNPLPFLMYTTGAVLSGAAVKELVKIYTSGKKLSVPTYDEADATGNREQQIYALIAHMQLASYGGFATDLIKMLTDLKSNRPSQGIGLPMADLISNNLWPLAGEGLHAIQSGEPVDKVLLAFSREMAKASVQNFRMVYNATHPEQVERQNKFRDLRVYKELTEGGRTSYDIPRGNRISDLAEKEFKQTPDLGKAVEILPEVIEGAIKKSNGDPYMLKKELTALKNNSYQTMPDPKTFPTSFMGYIQFLERTQGSKAASERLVDYMRQKEINKAKNALIPSL